MIPDPRTVTPYEMLAWLDTAPSFADLATFHIRNDANGYSLLIDGLYCACDPFIRYDDDGEPMEVDAWAETSDDAARLHTWLSEHSPEAAREIRDELADVYSQWAREEIEYAARD